MFFFLLQKPYLIMEKSQGVNILLLVILSLLPIGMCLQNQGGGVTDERVKLAGEENLHRVRVLQWSSPHGY